MAGLTWSRVSARPGSGLMLALLSGVLSLSAVFGLGYLSAVQDSVLRSGVEAADVPDRGVSVSIRAERPPTPDVLRARLADAVRAGGRTWEAPVAGATTSGLLTSPRSVLPVVARDEACGHLILAAGVCSQGRGDVVVAESTAAERNWQVGRTISIGDGGVGDAAGSGAASAGAGLGELRIVGIYSGIRDRRTWYFGRSLKGPVAEGTGIGSSEAAFVSGPTLTAGRWSAVEVTLDLPLDVAALTTDRLDRTRKDLAAVARSASLAGASTRTDLPDLLGRAARAGDQARAPLPSLIVQGLLLVLVVLAYVTVAAVGQRQGEAALALLRGQRRLRTARFLVADLLVLAVVGCVSGAFAGWALAGLAARLWLGPGVAVQPRWSMVAATAVCAVVAVAAVSASVVPVLRGSVTTMMRAVPPRGSAARAGALDGVVVALCVAGLASLAQGGVDGSAPTALAAPGLLAVAGGLLLSRLLVPVAALSGRRRLARGRLVSGLACLALARRPVMRRLVAIQTIAVALSVFAVSAAAVGADQRRRAAVREVGAAVVLDVGPVGPGVLGRAVAASDPGGRYAAGVTVAGQVTGVRTVFTDVGRFSRVASWDGSGRAGSGRPEGLAGIEPVTGPPVSMLGDSVELDVDFLSSELPPEAGPGAGHRGAPTDRPILSIDVVPASGAVVTIPLGRLPNGRTRFRAAVPCQVGCRLRSVAVTRASAAFPLSLIDLAVLSVTAGGHRVDLRPGDGWRVLSDDRTAAKVAADPRRAGGRPGGGPPGLRGTVTSSGSLTLRRADQPSTPPAAVTPGVPLSSYGIEVPDPEVPVDRLFAAPAVTGGESGYVKQLEVAGLPGVPGGAVLVSAAAVQDSPGDLDPSVHAQVWLSTDDPGQEAALVRVLATQDVQVLGRRSLALREHELGRQGPGLILHLTQLLAALALVLAVAALVVAAAVTRPARAQDRTNLRGMGVPDAVTGRSAVAEQALLALVAVVVGTALGRAGVWLVAAGGPGRVGAAPSWIVAVRPWLLPAAVAGAAVLLAVGLAASRRSPGRRSRREVPAVRRRSARARRRLVVPGLTPSRLRLVLAGIAYRRWTTMLLFSLATVASTAAVVAPLYADAAQESIVRSTLTHADRYSSTVHVQASEAVGGDPARTQAALRGVLPPGTFGAGVVSASGSSLTGPLDGAGADRTVELPFHDRQGLCARLPMVSGRCPEGEFEMALTTRSARLTRLRVGQSVVVRLASAGQVDEAKKPVRFTLVGTTEVFGTDDDYWVGGGGSLFTYYPSWRPQGKNQPSLPPIADHAWVTPGTAKALGLRSYAVDVPVAVDRIDRDRVPAVLAALASAQGVLEARGTPVVTQLPALIRQSDRDGEVVRVAVPLAAFQLVLLSWVILGQVVSAATQERSPELALAKLRGMTARGTAGFGLAEVLVLLLVAAPLGTFLGWWLVRQVAERRLAPGITLSFGPWVVVSVLLGVLGGSLAAAVAARSVLRRPVVELLRRVPGTGRRGSGVVAGAVLALVVAGLAEVLLSGGGGGRPGPVVAAAPGMTALGCGLIAAVVLRRWSGWRVGRAVAAGRVAGVLGWAALARRAGTARSTGVLAAAICLLLASAQIWAVAARERSVRALAEVGAEVVLDVRAGAPADVIEAVRAADPGGRYAMAAQRLPVDSGSNPVVAVDSGRVDAVIGYSGRGPGDLAAVLSAVPADPITLRPGLVRVRADTVSVDSLSPLSLSVTIADADTWREVPLGNLRPGPRTYLGRVPSRCAAGCRMVGLAVGHPDQGVETGRADLTLAGLATSDGVGRSAAWSEIAGDSARSGAWGAGPPDGNSSVAVRPGRTLRVQVGAVSGFPARIAHGGGPDAPPAIVRRGSDVKDGLIAVPGADGRPATARAVAAAEFIPSLDRSGGLIDLELSLRRVPAAQPTGMQVWLSRSDPRSEAALRAGLARSDVLVTGRRTADGVRERLDQEGTALALVLFLAAGLAAVLVAIGGLLVSAVVGSRDRRRDQAGLRLTGVPRPVLRQALLVESFAGVGVAMVCGVLAAVVVTLAVLPVLPLADPAATGPTPRASPDLVSFAVSLPAVTGLVTVLVVGLVRAQLRAGDGP